MLNTKYSLTAEEWNWINWALSKYAKKIIVGAINTNNNNCKYKLNGGPSGYNEHPCYTVAA